MKAISLLSGGLDSILATKMIIEQGVEVEALNFVTVFCNCTSGNKTCLASKSAADELGVPLKVMEVSKDYFEVIKNPKHGYGRNINPCLDCRIFMFHKTKEYMTESGASFVITGEVLGSRPMSQRRRAIEIIEEESGLEGYIVRPLSAKLFKPSIPEEKGWVDREQFLRIEGRSRKPQIQMAEDLGINDYPCPAGGCLLTDLGFANRMRDLINRKPEFDTNDVKLLKAGRLFRISPEARFVSGRNESENKRLKNLSRDGDICFGTIDVAGPVGVGRGGFTEEDITKAASIIARYSDVERDSEIDIAYEAVSGDLSGTIRVSSAHENELNMMRV